jgi:hypothetical protein
MAYTAPTSAFQTAIDAYVPWGAVASTIGAGAEGVDDPPGFPGDPLLVLEGAGDEELSLDVTCPPHEIKKHDASTIDRFSMTNPSSGVSRDRKVLASAAATSR